MDFPTLLFHSFMHAFIQLHANCTASMFKSFLRRSDLYNAYESPYTHIRDGSEFSIHPSIHPPCPQPDPCEWLTRKLDESLHWISYCPGLYCSSLPCSTSVLLLATSCVCLPRSRHMNVHQLSIIRPRVQKSRSRSSMWNTSRIRLSSEPQGASKHSYFISITLRPLHAHPLQVLSSPPPVPTVW